MGKKKITANDLKVTLSEQGITSGLKQEKIIQRLQVNGCLIAMVSDVLDQLIKDEQSMFRLLNDAAITQIGIAAADSKFELLSKALIQIDPRVWNSCERTFSGETILWWLNQENGPVVNNQTLYSYQQAMDVLDKILVSCGKDIIIWTKGTMDLFCIKDLYEHFDRELPWQFWQPRDIRTAKEFIKEWKTFENNNHNALDDALNQLRELKANLMER